MFASMFSWSWWVFVSSWGGYLHIVKVVMAPMAVGKLEGGQQCRCSCTCCCAARCCRPLNYEIISLNHVNRTVCPTYLDMTRLECQER
jgi:hypothetical protein